MKKFLTLCFIVNLSQPLLLSRTASGAKVFIKCWQDDHGIRECGSVVPQEYSRNRIEVINENGVVVQVIEATRTKEEQEREQEREHARRAREAKLAEQKRRDENLLNSYTTEKDLITARDKTLEGIASQIDILKSNLKIQRTNFEQLNHEAGNYERNGKTPPAKLVENIHTLRQEIDKLETSYQLREDELENITQRYEDDLKRFRELKRQTLMN
ncbi:MAG: hypothetical protein HY080_10125 [Gammaproteobacteria bacterium]|nr:hypothetical protein [Gammaproteobacteria bacterium]